MTNNQLELKKRSYEKNLFERLEMKLTYLSNKSVSWSGGGRGGGGPSMY